MQVSAISREIYNRLFKLLIRKMGRGRGKGKKQSSVAARDDTASGEDEKLPVRRRGRPQKQDIEEEDKVLKIEDEDDNDDMEEIKSSVLSKNTKNQAATENGRKRKRASQVKENGDWVKEQNGIVTKTNANDLIKSVGYRQNGSRRKNKPRRAAEVGFKCK